MKKKKEIGLQFIAYSIIAVFFPSPSPPGSIFKNPRRIKIIFGMIQFLNIILFLLDYYKPFSPLRIVT